MSATAIQDGNANDATLNAVILYGTFDVAVKAATSWVPQAGRFASRIVVAWQLGRWAGMIQSTNMNSTLCQSSGLTP